MVRQHLGRRAALAAVCATALVAGGVAAAVSSDDSRDGDISTGGPAVSVADAAELFAAPVRYRTANPKAAHPPGGVAVADLDGDGVADLATGLLGAPHVFVMRSDGKGGYRPGTTVAVSYQARQVHAGDIDSDGDADLVVPQRANGVAILTNDGRARFTVRYEEAGPDPRRAQGVEPRLALADVDGDGRTDVVAVTTRVYVLRNTVQGLTKPVAVSGPTERALLALGDLTGDGAPELLLGIDRDGVATVARNDGAGLFPTTYAVSAGVRTPPPVVYRSSCRSFVACRSDRPGPVGIYPTTAAALADLDRDGRLDLVVSHAYTPGLTIAPGDGRGGFGSSRRIAPTLEDVDTIAAADVNADGVPDLVTLVPHGRSVGVILGASGGGYAEAALLPAVRGWTRGVQVADVDGDSDADLVVADVQKCRLAVLRNTRRPEEGPR